MTPLPPYQQPGAQVVFWLLVGLMIATEYVMRFRIRRGGRTVELWSLAVVFVTIFIGIGGGVRLATWQPGRVTAGDWPLFIAGVCLMAFGLLVRQWAIFTLGRYFTPDVRVHAHQVVVDRGPYRWVRHPSYTGLVLFHVGLGLALTNWAALALIAVVPTAGWNRGALPTIRCDP